MEENVKKWVKFYLKGHGFKIGESRKKVIGHLDGTGFVVG